MVLRLLADDDLDFADDAVELIGVGARQAADRLQFYRFALRVFWWRRRGWHTTAGSCRPSLGGSRITCEYGESTAVLPLEWQKLACNLLLVGADALPRGGRLVLATAILEVEAIGEAPALSPETLAALTLVAPVQFAHLANRSSLFRWCAGGVAGCRLVGRAEPRRVRLAAVISAD